MTDPEQDSPLAETEQTEFVRHALVSEELRSAARTLSNQDGSRRTTYKALGLRPLWRDRIFGMLSYLVFLMCFLAPFSAGVAYYLVYVTPQYEAETRFVLRSALPALSEGDDENDTNTPSMKIVQDTQVLVSFLDSSTLVALIDDEIGMASLYGREDIDWTSRLRSDDTLSDVTEYFGKFISAKISPASGIVVVKLRAFSPGDANRLLTLVMDLAEERVNLLNADIWRSVLEAAEREFEAAGADLQQARERFQKLQNETGVFDIELEAEALTEVLTELRKELFELENRRSTLLISVSDKHPNVLRFNRQIDVRREQIEALERQIADAQTETTSLADNQQLFEELSLKIEIAQDRFKRAAADLEQSKLLSSIKMLYVDQFMQITLPDSIAYPQAAWQITKLLVFCLSSWAAAILLLTLIRNRLD